MFWGFHSVEINAVSPKFAVFATTFAVFANTLASVGGEFIYFNPRRSILQTSFEFIRLTS